MGMFDSFKVDMDNVVNLPLPKDGTFQSKDLDCQLIEYRITKDGKLTLESKPSDGNKQWAALLKDMIANPACALSKIACGEFSGPLDIYGHVHNTGKWEEYSLLLESNEILLIMNYDRLLYSRDPESTEQLLEVLRPQQWFYNKTQLSPMEPQEETYHLGSKMLSLKHLPQNMTGEDTKKHPRGTPSMANYFSGNGKPDNVDALFRDLKAVGMSKLADGRYVRYKNPEVKLPPNHMVLMTHIDENEKDVLHLVTHPRVVSVNDLMVIVTDQDGNVLEQHPTLWQLQTARSSKAVEEGKENTFDLFIHGMLEEYGSTALLYPHMTMPLTSLCRTLESGAHVTPAGNIKPNWQKGK